MKLCPCGTQQNYSECCGAYLTKKCMPDTPEALMRSRYTAFVEKNAYYIKQTMRDPARKNFNQKSIENSKGKWMGLEVVRSFIDAKNAHIGFVEFKAQFIEHESLRIPPSEGEEGKEKQDSQIIHELSEFHYIDGRWYYVNGKNLA